MKEEETKFGIVFDIDGVLMKDGVPIAGAVKALNMLVDQQTKTPIYPYVFVTNNGGFSEKEKAKKISSVLDFDIEEDRVMVAHTPMKELAEKYKNDGVIVVARKHETAVSLAQLYGFHQFTTIQQYVDKRQFLYPGKYSKFWTLGIKNQYEESADIVDNNTTTVVDIKYKAIIMFEEPAGNYYLNWIILHLYALLIINVYWGEELQILSDILQTKDGVISIDKVNKSDVQEIDLHVANPDFTYGGEFIMPRYTMGAFIQCLSTLYRLSTRGRDLAVTFYGKPYASTYNYAKELMGTQVKKLNQLGTPKHIYAIGDNPHSDIKGANQLENEGWISILVRTGVFKGDNDIENPAKYVVDDVLDAINLIMKLENNNRKKKKKKKKEKMMMTSNTTQDRGSDAATIQVRDIDPQVTEALLWELMIQVAPVVKVFMPKDKLTQQHSGRAYVEFQSENDADYAMRILNYIKLFGRPIKLKKVRINNKDKVDVGANLFIGNLDAEVDEKILHDTFIQFGAIIQPPKIMRDTSTGVSKGFGFVSYDNFASSDASIEAMNGEFLCNKPISVTYARKKDSTEKHGSQAERMIAAGKQRGIPMFAQFGGMPPPPGIVGGMPMPPPPPFLQNMSMPPPPPPTNIPGMGMPPPPPPPSSFDQMGGYPPNMFNSPPPFLSNMQHR
ncbi:RNA-binding region RNP-1 domain-containing protein [Cavenderia fasciculata]|uniref:RNA-binding region RNP-1 domain-containing protein n=1 Tax=Cavenderia fasciculata TaxID=261658 RepID=F4Q1V9_CACFS|nr:RNA-binding region RNP-1 domain-containing protein [Cavenderia fasciculata]EGG17979.1 RNA-binding region RNP-1 domain-containing protein [Cavenderia fasciculata]|eukprot:XP_004356871.1 RNA-binding region RNP-1 domain-containing protein [Cavenderia fasciculata]